MTGDDLIKMGYKPGKHFAEMLRVGNVLRLHDLSDKQIKEALDEIYEEAIFEAPTIPLQEPIEYTNNIFVDVPRNDFEKLNVNAALDHMDEIAKVPTVRSIAVMPDVCPAGSQLGTIPVGGVVATENAIHPGMHSSDICCSMFMTELDLPEWEAKAVLDAAQRVTHFGVGGRKDFPLGDGHYILQRAQDNRFLASIKMFKAMSEHHMTQGDGNHFFYVGKRESTGRLTIVTHHGSRSPGALLYKEGMRVAKQFKAELAPSVGDHNAWIPADTEEGEWYWEALQIIREWTKYNHRSIHDNVMASLGIHHYVDRFWNEHNFVFKKDGLFYHAKGSTPMFEAPVDDDLGSDLRIIPLNMAEPILIAKAHKENTFGFAPHGAGRNYSRTQFMKMNAHKTAEQIMKEQTSGIDARFYSGVPDMSELPGAYKDAKEVQRQIEHFKLAEIVDRVLPLGCIMAGEFDKPWRKK